MTRSHLILCLLAIMTACKPTTMLEVVQPALITLPDHVNVLATIDRSKPSSGFINVLEGGVTGESIHQDRDGRKNALDALAEALSRTPRFKVVHTGLEYTGTETGSTFAQPLPWDEIASICEQYDADAVIAIEKFDTDNRREVTSRKKKVKRDDKEIEVTVYDGSLEVDVHLGWRIYDLKSQRIIDEVDVSDGDNDSRSGVETEDELLEDLADARALTYRVSQRAGRKYAERIAPIWITVNRSFYKKAKGPEQEEMAKAARLFETDSWNEAVDIWHTIVERPSTSSEVKGMSAYNLAVAYEKRGMLPTALSWAQNAYGQHGNKKARNYVSILQDRIHDQEILREQLKQRS
ncbi:MAG: hypothetical protein HKN87_21695 [Saprospiraceae bacterium]|nr:hypothetical protein [Saprospiraceae bacterium]